MTKPEETYSSSKKDINGQKSLEEIGSGSTNPPKKGPLSFLSGSLTSFLFSWMSLLLSRNVVLYFTLHTTNYSSPIAQSVASGFKTLVIGMCFLSTFTFGFIGLGLMIVFIRSLFTLKEVETQ
tara:strand:- start:99 stop:467 length:369 start_codon:yes stop_codon:yes gene_type:complete